MVIVGAGASYGCRDSFSSVARISENGRVLDAAEEEWRPPLTTELFKPRPAFARILGRYGAARGLAGRLQRQLTEDDPEPLEHLLATFVGEEVDSPVRRRELLGLRMYLQELLLRVTQWVRSVEGGVTLYDELVSTVSEWAHETGTEVVYLSLNYDLLLDEAIQHLYGIELDEIKARGRDQFSRYLVADGVRLIKPHGSVNWWRAMDSSDSDRGGRIVPAAPDMLETDDFRIRTEPVATVRASNEFAWVPVLALPVEGKTTVVAPDEHMQLLDEITGKVRAILSIGWRGLEPHLLNRIRDATVREAFVTVCDTDDESGRQVASRLRQGLTAGANAPDWKPGGFAGLFQADRGESSVLQSWLNSVA